ncbi:MAG: glycosyltransferase family 2 protein [Chloroflexi bacterium]|nr:glycosyltransferase family 2 protein [Chloroflexota bacterium]
MGHSDMNVTAVVLTLNEEDNIEACLASLAWADHRVIVDSFSNDCTVELARRAGAEVFQHPFQNYAEQHNVALERVSADWILFVDADERATPDLATEVRTVTDGSRPEAAWAVPRHNYIFGRLTRGGGWYPDYQTRLLRRGRVRWERPVHEIAVVDGAIGYLKSPLIHNNYSNPADFHARQKRYNAYDAEILYNEGARPRRVTPYLQALRHFWWRLITLKGYRDGLHGLRLCTLMGYYEMRKYQRVAELIEGRSI